jgi:hypothetical protein
MFQVSEHDLLPSLICHRCVYKLDVLYDFKEVGILSYKTLPVQI